MIVRQEPVYVRRRRIAMAFVLAGLVAVVAVAGWLGGRGAASEAATTAAGLSIPRAHAVTAAHVGLVDRAGTGADGVSAGAPKTAGASKSPAASDLTKLVRRDRIAGGITPKSVAASPSGMVVAQNMMYGHAITAYRPDGTLLATVKDAVRLADYGVAGHPGIAKGAPVEAAFTHDGKHLYVSNYSMYGTNFGPEGKDACTPAQRTDKSFVYRVDAATKQIDKVIPVGAVPKYVAVTPDDRRVLVTNWCSDDLSVIDTATGRVTSTVPLGSYPTGGHPRGIAVSPDSRTAYVALMGADRLVKVDLGKAVVSPLSATGDGPRHVVISGDGRYLFVTNSNSGTVTKVNASSGAAVASVRTGVQPRSMTISPDGRALYVVNYESATLSKLRASDLKQVQTVRTDHHPIGVTYEPTTRSLWVACYSGSILVFEDTLT